MNQRIHFEVGGWEEHLISREELISRIGKAECRNGRTRYGRELRQSILEYAKARTAEGKSMAFVSEELGVKECTLHGWRQKSRKPGDIGREPPAVSFVKLEPASPAGGMPLEVVLKQRIVVRIPVGFDSATLSRVVTALGEAS